MRKRESDREKERTRDRERARERRRERERERDRQERERERDREKERKRERERELMMANLKRSGGCQGTLWSHTQADQTTVFNGLVRRSEDGSVLDERSFCLK